MTASTYTTNLTDVYAGAGSTTGWTALGGGASGLNAETDYFIQGTGCTSKNAFASARKGMILNDGTDRASTIGTDGAVMMWTTHTAPGAMDTLANGGLTLLVGSGTADYKHWYVAGGDTLTFLGWVIAAVNPSETTDEADAGTPTAVEDHFGALFDLPSGGPTKGAPNAIDAIRVGRCDLIYEFGTGADPEATFDLAVADKGDVTDRLGLIQERGGSFFFSGLHQLGSATNAVEFTDSAKACFWNDHPAVTAPFNTVDIQNASSIINMTNISWKALGTKSPGTWTTTDDATVNLTGCNFTDWGTFAFDANTTVRSTTFLGCDEITANQADLATCAFLSPSVAADGGAVIWDEALAAPRSIVELNNTTFEQGAAAHHAITFGTGIDEDITLTGIAFNGFSSTADANGSTLEFLGTTGAINVNLVGCTVDGAAATTANVGVDDAAGIAVTLVVDPVTVLVNVKDNAGANIQNARVFLETAATAAGGEVFEAAVTSITSASGVATLTSTAPHGLATGDNIVVRGAQPDDYNKTAVCTVTGASTLTYPVTTGISSPATGTPLLSYVAIHGLTSAGGDASVSRTFGGDQAFKGWARKKNASSPFYKDGDLSFTVDSTNGNTVNTILQPDE
jgi:hypothetical protein